MTSFTSAMTAWQSLLWRQTERLRVASREHTDHSAVAGDAVPLNPSLCLESSAERPPLRIGLLVDDVELPGCFAEVLDHLARTNFARIELVVLNGERNPGVRKPAGSRLRRLAAILRDRRRRKALLFSAYERWDSRCTDAAVNPLSPVDCSARMRDAETMTVRPIRTGFVHRFPADAVEQIRAKNLDVILRFGFGILRGDVLSSAKYGVWSYHHGDNSQYRGGPAYFWEIVEGNPLSGAVLQVLTEELDNGTILARGLFATVPGLSHARNQLRPFWGAAPFVIQKLHELHQFGWEHLAERTCPPQPAGARIYSAPSNAEMIRWLAPAIVGKAITRLKPRPGVPFWRLGVRANGCKLLDQGCAPRLDGFQWIKSPRGRFYADPFLVEQAGKPWLFFEDADLHSGRGTISAAEVRDDGTLGDTVRALERPYHLSYPHVIRDGGDLFLIPETRQNRAVELYRCERFPDRWVLEEVLFRGQAVDTTVWIEHGTYWFFVTLVEPRGGAMQLCLFSSDALAGPWRPHPANPISQDVRNCRGAGAIFRDDAGRLIRPSQNCSTNYGRSFRLNEIVTLNRDRYEERVVAMVEPPAGFIGTHSYARAGCIEIVDACARVPRRHLTQL